MTDLVSLRALTEREGYSLETRTGSTVRLNHPNGSFMELDAHDYETGDLTAEAIEAELRFLHDESEAAHGRGSNLRLDVIATADSFLGGDNS